MRSLVEFVFDLGYRREWYAPIRDDFIRWYSFACEHPDAEEAFSDEDVSTLAYRAGHEARNFDPDNQIVDAIQLIETIREKINTVLSYLKVAAAIFTFLAAGTFQLNVHIAVPSFISTLVVVFLTPPAIYHVIKHQISSNIELIRKFNRELVKWDFDIWTDRRKKNRIAYYLWNRTLNKSNTIVVIVVLMIVRAASPRIYGQVNEMLRKNMTQFIEEGIWSVSKKEMKNTWNQHRTHTE